MPTNQSDKYFEATVFLSATQHLKINEVVKNKGSTVILTIGKKPYYTDEPSTKLFLNKSQKRRFDKLEGDKTTRMKFVFDQVKHVIPYRFLMGVAVGIEGDNKISDLEKELRIKHADVLLRNAEALRKGQELRDRVAREHDIKTKVEYFMSH